MTAKHIERVFEDAIEHHLVTAGGWRKVDPTTFDRERALLPNEVFTFIEATQGALWSELRAQHGTGLEAAVLDTLSKSLATRGTLDVIRHGFKFFGKTIQLATFKPAHRLNPDVLSAYAGNRLAVTRQVRFAPVGDKDEDQSIDMMLSLNGLPVT
jgi:type I restriction enzyme R subunit